MNLQGSNVSLPVQGDDVALLQRELDQLGYIMVPSEMEGKIFRNTLRNAVLDFQRKRGQVWWVSKTAPPFNTAVDVRDARRYMVQGQVRRQDGNPLTRMTGRIFISSRSFLT